MTEPRYLVSPSVVSEKQGFLHEFHPLLEAVPAALNVDLRVLSRRIVVEPANLRDGGACAPVQEGERKDLTPVDQVVGSFKIAEDVCGCQMPHEYLFAVPLNRKTAKLLSDCRITLKDQRRVEVAEQFFRLQDARPRCLRKSGKLGGKLAGLIAPRVRRKRLNTALRDTFRSVEESPQGLLEGKDRDGRDHDQRNG